MSFELKIKNLGKLSDAKIRVGPFTVLAGPNNTGKSFVSKILYSLFDAMNANHALVHIDSLIKPIRSNLDRLINLPRSVVQRRLFGEDLDRTGELLVSIRAELELLHIAVADIPIGDLDRLNKILPVIRTKAKEAELEFLDVSNSFNPPAGGESDSVRFSRFSQRILEIKQDFKILIDNMDSIDGIRLIAAGIEHKTKDNIIQNFQIETLSDLNGKKEDSSIVEIEELGKFEISNEGIDFSVDSNLVLEFQQFSNLIYLESPIYWKLKTALEILSVDRRYAYRGREKISGVPGYFYDLASALKSRYSGDVNETFQNLHERLNSAEFINGKIVVSESGDFSFHENGRDFAMSITATGVVNLGVLALLIERKILDEDSFLFIDEPEAHLHPAWQVVMAETLFELAKGGVNVVIATHSADILKWLEVHVKHHPEDKELIALNKFPFEGNEDDHDGQNFEDKMATIKQELTKPFAELYTAGLS